MKCDICENKLEHGDSYCYSDPKNGIEKDITICTECLLTHVNKHYGTDCAISKHLTRISL